MDEFLIVSLRRVILSKGSLYSKMIEEIRDELSQIADREGVKILLAVESGSRAWGFASPDSDWDVRFVYVRSADAYLSLNQPRDVIEQMGPGEMDFAGWDLRKALGLFAKTNPGIFEWLHSSDQYMVDRDFLNAMHSEIPRVMRLERGLHHYRSMAKTNFLNNLQGEVANHKKYLYVLRPLLACDWILKRRTWPPILFSDLVTAADLDSEVLASLDRLLDQKRRSGELATSPHDKVLLRFVTERLRALEPISLPGEAPVDLAELDPLFLRFLQ